MLVTSFFHHKRTSVTIYFLMLGYRQVVQIFGCKIGSVFPFNRIKNNRKFHEFAFD